MLLIIVYFEIFYIILHLLFVRLFVQMLVQFIPSNRYIVIRSKLYQSIKTSGQREAQNCILVFNVTNLAAYMLHLHIPPLGSEYYA